MKKAFTMIELIFVIVIIGILVSIAIPKLTVTRDDAKISSIIANTRITLSDLQAYYTSRGNINWQTENITQATSVPLETACGTLTTSTTPISPNTFVLCNDNIICLSFETINEGNLTVTNGTDTTDTICEAVKLDSTVRSISNRTYKLSGMTVER